jgi:hypothetical protein
MMRQEIDKDIVSGNKGYSNKQSGLASVEPNTIDEHLLVIDGGIKKRKFKTINSRNHYKTCIGC